MSFNISFDYRFDSTGFFTADVRSALEAVAADWEAVIQDEFADVPAGVAFAFESPSQAPQTRSVTLAEPIDDLRVFVGAQSPPFGQAGEAIAKGGVRGFDAAGDILQRRITNDFRDQGPVTDFEPFVGVMSVDPTVDWRFDSDNPENAANDFRSVARHEIGHVLGIGQAQVFRDNAANGSFDGPNSRSVNGGDPIPLSADGAHTLDSFRDGAVLMSPSLQVGSTQAITDVDKALLADIGYEIDGFDAQGSQPAITTDDDDRPIRGTVLADVLDAGAGDDKLQGDAGGDTLAGGSGADTILGQAGDDVLRGGAGDDKVQGGFGNDVLRGGPGNNFLFGNGSGKAVSSGDRDIFFVGPGDGTIAIQEDFSFDNEKIVIDPRLGFEDAQEVLSNTFQIESGSGIDLRSTSGEGPFVSIVHEPQGTSPLTADNIAIKRLDAVTDDTGSGSSGGDDSGGSGNSGGSGGDTDAPVPPDGPPVDVVANAFLAAGQGITAGDPVSVFGRSGGSEAVVLDIGAAGIRADANIERFDFPEPLSAMHFAATQRGLEISADGNRLVTLPSLNQTVELHFTDGNATLNQTGAETFELSGANDTSAILDSSGGGADVDLGSATSRAGTDGPPEGQMAANVFLAAEAGLTVREPVAVFGRSEGNESVTLAEGAAGVRMDANIEEITVPQTLDALRFGVTGAGLEIQTGDQETVVGLPSLNQPMAVQFANGNATLSQTRAEQFELAGGTGDTATIAGDPETLDLDLGESTSEAITAVATAPDPDGGGFA